MVSFYEDYYDEEDLQFRPLNEKRIVGILGAIESRTGVGRVLDVGCGSGHLLKVAASRGWIAYGTEIAKSALFHLSSFPFQIFPGDLLDARFPSNFFEFIVVSEVIEHVLTPKEWISEIFRILKPNGRLLLTTPNRDSLSRRLLRAQWRVFRPDHLSYFTVPVLAQAIRDAGFVAERQRTKNIDLSEIYLKLLRGGPVASRECFRKQQRFRAAVENSALLRAAKGSANLLLEMLRLGDTIELQARKPSHP